MIYLLLKWLHVLSALVSVGANVTYGVWIGRASSKPEFLPFTLKSIKQIDDRIANPMYGLLLITGLLMVLTVKLPLTTPWLLTALILYALVVLIGLLGYTPTLKRQIAVLESDGFQSEGYRALARRGSRLGMLLAVIVISIIFLMVVKPALWM